MAWKLPPLNPLRAFEATARLGSMTRAAAELSVTQVAVTRQIATLEQTLRVKLFHRGSRQIQLTPAGENLFITVTRAFRDLQAVAEEISGKQQRHQLNIRGYSNFTLRWLIPHLAGFHAKHPEIDLQLTSSLDPVDFERSDFDAAIRCGDGRWPNWDCTPLAPVDLLPVCSPRLMASGRGPREATDLAGHTLLHSVARPHDWATWLKAAGAAEVNAYGGIKFDNGGLAYQAAIEGIGIAIAQRVLVVDDLRAGRLTAPFPLTVSSGESYYLVAPRGRLTPKLRAFRDWIVSVSQTAYVGVDQGLAHQAPSGSFNGAQGRAGE